MRMNDVNLVSQVVNKLEPMSDQRIHLILVGGCSRSGKSTFSQQLADEIRLRHHSAVVLSMDSWIIGVDERPKNSSVKDRYDLPQIVRSVEALLKAQPVQIPIYDVKSRKRLADQRELVCISSGYLILEGVLALSSDKLRQCSQLSIYVDIEDSVRKQRFEIFYSKVKGLSPKEIKDLFAERELDEVAYVKQTRRCADVVYFEKKLTN